MSHNWDALPKKNYSPKYYFGDRSKKNEMSETFGTYGRGVYRVWVGKWERRRPLVIATLRGEDNFKTNLQKIWWSALELYRNGARQGQVMRYCASGNEPFCSIKCGEFLD
jgi:hypothetical protein